MDIKKVGKLADSIWTKRDAVNSTLEELARYIYPDSKGFVSKPDAGAEDREAIWDSAPEEAASMLASALSGLLTNPATDWLALELPGNEGQGGDAGGWLTEAGRTMLKAFAAPNSQFYQEIQVFYMELAVLGWAVFLTEYRDGEGLYFKSVPASQCAIAENARGIVDTVVRRFSMTAGQMAEEFGKDNLSQTAQGALKKDPFKEFVVTHLVMPWDKLPEEIAAGDDGVGKSRLSEHKYVSVSFEQDGEKPLKLSGYYEFPYAVPRWSKRSGEVYGRGCGHAALPDIRVLNKVSLSQLDAAQKASNPPLLVPDDSVIDRKINTFAGGITYWRPVGGEIIPLPITANLDVMQLIREDRRAAIQRLFLNDRIQLVGGPQMTATEIIARERKQAQVLGPVLGRLQSEHLGPMVTRVFGLLYRAGQLPDPPEELKGREMSVRYISPISRAQKQGEAEALQAAMGHIAPLVQLGPELMDNFDQDRIVRDTQELFGYPEDYLRKESEVKKIRQDRQQNAQAAAQAEAAMLAMKAAGSNQTATGL